MTNTNWQCVQRRERRMSYFVQMAALAVQNFVSAAAGIAVAIALIRGFARHETGSHRQLLGRSDARDGLHPAADLDRRRAGLRLAGVDPELPALHAARQTVEGATQTIAQGPVASQVAIKMLGTNGGGFFNANSAHPFENPTPFTNLLQIVLIFSDRRGPDLHVRQDGAGHAAGLGAVRGDGGDVPGRRVRRVRRRAGAAIRHSRSWASRRAPHGDAVRRQHGRQGGRGSASPTSALFATVTTDASCGAVNSMHDSFTPLGGLVPLFNIQTGEVIFGGVGAGLYGMLLYAILARLHRRADGRPHAGVPRQEDRAEGSEDGDARDPRHGVQHPGLHRARAAVIPFAKGSYWNPQGPAIANLNNGGAARLQRDPLRVHERRRETTAARLRASPRTRRGTT